MCRFVHTFGTEGLIQGPGNTRSCCSECDDGVGGVSDHLLVGSDSLRNTNEILCRDLDWGGRGCVVTLERRYSKPHLLVSYL